MVVGRLAQRLAAFAAKRIQSHPVADCVRCSCVQDLFTEGPACPASGASFPVLERRSAGFLPHWNALWRHSGNWVGPGLGCSLGRREMQTILLALLVIALGARLSSQADLSSPGRVCELQGIAPWGPAAARRRRTRRCPCRCSPSLPAAGVLLEFAAAARGDNADALADWHDGSDACTWTGVACSGQAVTALRLPGAGLRGTLAPGLAQLTSLQHMCVAEAVACN